jgi:hypothetical protein
MLITKYEIVVNYYPFRIIQSIPLVKGWSRGGREFVMSPSREGDNSVVSLFKALDDLIRCCL